MPARHIDSIHDRYELQPTPRCQSSTSLSCSFTSGGWREGWGAEEPGGGGGGGRRVLNFIILPRGGGAASCCCCSPAAGTHRATSDSGPQLSSWAKLTLERVLFHPLSSAQLWHFSSLHWLTDTSPQQKPSLQSPGLGGVVFSCPDVVWVWKCTAAVSYLSWFAANSAQSGLGRAASRGLTAARRPAAPAQPLPSRQCFLRTRSHLLTSDRGFKFLTNTFPETFIVKQSYSQIFFTATWAKPSSVRPSKWAWEDILPFPVGKTKKK